MDNSRFKFRAWDTKKQIFVPNGDIIFSDYGDTRITVNPNCMEYIGDSCHNYNEDSRFKIMQYTGLKDKNEVEIYEGDIVIEKSYPFYGNASEITDSNQKCDELNYVGVIVWDNGYYVDLKVVSDRVRGSSIGQSLYDYEELEVIGNIYENKELLN